MGEQNGLGKPCVSRVRFPSRILPVVRRWQVFEYPGDHWPRGHLRRIFIALVVVVVLAFIKGEVDLPEQGRSNFICGTYHAMNVVHDRVAKLKAQFRIVETTGQKRWLSGRTRRLGARRSRRSISRSRSPIRDPCWSRACPPAPAQNPLAQPSRFQSTSAPSSTL